MVIISEPVTNLLTFQQHFIGLPAHGDFTLETESFLTALQDQAIMTRAMQHVFNSSLSPLCRLCGQHIETVQHLLIGCSVLAGGAYKVHHDKVAINLH